MHSCWSFEVEVDVLVYTWILILDVRERFVRDADCFEWLGGYSCCEKIIWVGFEWIVINTEDLVLA